MTSSGNKKIYPRCKGGNSQVYVNADGLVLPCCWLGNFPYLQWVEEFYGKDIDKLNCQNKALSKVLASEQFKKIENSWDSSEPFKGCLFFCSKPLPQNNKDVHRSRNNRIFIQKEDLD